MILSDDEVLHAWDDDPTWFRPKFKASHLEANARIRELEAKLQELKDAARKAINLYAEAVIHSIDILERADRAEAKLRELIQDGDLNETDGCPLRRVCRVEEGKDERKNRDVRQRGSRNLPAQYRGLGG